MSLKIYRPDKRWTVVATKLASSMMVQDHGNRFRAQTKSVENCLSELKDDLLEAQKAIKYIYDHGGNGEGGGSGSGGGSLLPTLKIITPLEYTITTDELIEIQYSFTSPNRGNGWVQLSGAGTIEEKEIPQGTIQIWKVGPFKKGNYNLSINVSDSQGFWSGAQTIKINVGTLEIIDNFDHNQTFLPGERISIPFRIESASPADKVKLLKEFNNTKTEEDVLPGNKTWDIVLPSIKGVYKGTLQAKMGTISSNIIKYSVIAADASTLYMTTNSPTFPEVLNAKLNQNLVIEYMVSMLGQSFFDVEYWRDSVKVDTVTAQNSVYTPWIVGNDLSLGTHELKIVAKTRDGQYSTQLLFNVDVSIDNFIPFEPITEGLIAHFESTGNQQSSATRNQWKNKVLGNTISCTLHNFNYNSNGWVVVPRTTDLPRTGSLYELPPLEVNNTETVLRMSGRSYAEIDYRPLELGMGKGSGLTVEILYRCENTGDPNAKVISCKNYPDDTKGFSIDTGYANIKTSYGESVSVGFNENEWVRMSFVIDRSSGKMLIYCNGILSGFSNIQPIFGAEDGFKIDQKIYLGAAFFRKIIIDPDGTKRTEEYMDNFANCDIRSVRIYNRTLNQNEILQNYIADIKIPQEQLIIRKINGFEVGFDETIPSLTVFNAGDIDGSDMALPCTLIYSDPRNPQKNKTFYNSTIQWQGTSSLEYPVKNYTIKLTSGGSPYYGWTPKDEWRPEARWTLKANFMDSSQSNNIGFCKFAHDLFLQNVYPIQKQKDKVRTNVDGFPIKLYVDDGNGSIFKGIYTFNIDRYSYNNFGFVDYKPDGSSVKNTEALSYEFNVNNSPVFELDYTTPEAKQRAWMDTVRFHFKCRYHGKTDSPTEIITSGSGTTEVLFNMANHKELMDLLEWMASFKDTPDDRARWISELDDHFSVDHLIDYFILAYMFGMVDSMCKNLVLSNFGKTTDAEGNQLTIWYPVFYDADSILGLNNVGANVVSPGAELNTEFVTKDLRLWKWLIEDVNMWDKIKRRYMDLRYNVVNANREPLLSINNLMSYIGGRVSDTIGHKLYNLDFEYKYLNAKTEAHRYMCQGTRRSFIERWLRERLTFLDSLFGYGNFESELITMRTNILGTQTIRIKTYTPQKTTVQFQAGSAPVVKTTNNNSFVDFTFDFTNSMDNELKIKGAANIMAIEGLDALNLSVLKTDGAINLTNIEVPRNSLLRELVVGPNTKLRTLDVSNSMNLGSDYPNGTINQNKILDLSMCKNLRVLKCTHTKLEGITFPSDGGVIEVLECSNTNISNFKLYGQEYITEINLNDCPKLSDVSVEKCDGITTFNMPLSIVRNVSLLNCKKLTSVDLSYTNYLTTFNIVECPEVTSINLKGVVSKNIKDLDLSSLLKLISLDITDSNSIESIVFGKNRDGSNYTGVTNLKCTGSSIRSIRFNKFDPIPDYLDLAGFNLSSLSFYRCGKLQEIRNINYVGPGYSVFRECPQLKKIQGSLKFIGVMSETFRDSGSLTSIPCGSIQGDNLDLSEVTSLYLPFYRTSVTMDVAKAVMSKLTDKVTSAHGLFKSSGITGAIPENLFEKIPNCAVINECFMWTNVSGNIPPNLLKPLTKLKSATHLFYDASYITGTIPENIFAFNPLLEDISYCFYRNGLSGQLPRNLFVNNRNLKRVSSAFNTCRKLTGDIPQDIFRNCPHLTEINYVFANNEKLTGAITKSFLDTNNGQPNEITNAEGLFYRNAGLTGEIPPDLFALSPLLTNLKWAFYECSRLTGPIPEGLITGLTRLTNINGMFRGCTNLGVEPTRPAVIPPNFLNWKNNLDDIRELFMDCHNIQGEIPEYFLREAKKCIDIEGLFKGCRGLTGHIPRDIFNINPAIISVARVFEGCSGLSGEIPARIENITQVPIDPQRPELGNTESVTVVEYGLFDKIERLVGIKNIFAGCSHIVGEIPPKLFMNCANVEDASGVFARCARLTGQVPEELLSYMPRLKTTREMFSSCVGLKNPIFVPDDERYMYILPKNLFINNKYLEDVQGMFSGSYQESGGPLLNMSLTGYLHHQFFQGPGMHLKHIDSMFYNVPGLKGELSANLFNNNTSLQTAYRAFGRTKLESLGATLFKTCTQLTVLGEAFDGCTSLRGESFDYLALTKVTDRHWCFRGCTGLANYAELQAAGWA